MPSLIFMGTPDFAVPSLKRLAASGARIHLVVTQPDRPSGRGKKLTPPPVKVAAQALGLPVYQPERVRPQEVIDHIAAFGAECAAVVAFGQILPQSFLDRFLLGALNVHASLLPRYRGAAPIHRGILAGESQTGVSIMRLDSGMDTGPVLMERAIPIRPEDTLGSLHDALTELGASLLLEALPLWKAGSLRLHRQDESLATYAPPIQKAEQQLNWALSAFEVYNAIRAFDPAPGAFTFYAGKRLKCFGASLWSWTGSGRAGEVAGVSEQGLVVFTGDGQAVCIRDLQMEGQRRLPAFEYLRGHPIPAGTVLGENGIS